MNAQKSATVLFLISLALPLLAQSPAPSGPSINSTYDPRVTFAPLTLPEPANSYRSGDGAPGAAYWQNEADYVMHAKIDTDAKVLSNDEMITYTNNSPDTLYSVWIHLEQNTYRKDSRARNLGNTGFRRIRPGGPIPGRQNTTETFTEGMFLSPSKWDPHRPERT